MTILETKQEHFDDITYITVATKFKNGDININHSFAIKTILLYESI